MAVGRRPLHFLIVAGLAVTLVGGAGAAVLLAQDPDSPSASPLRVAVPKTERRVTPKPSTDPSADPATACDATVAGTDAAAVESAAAEAGRGIVCFPAGRYAGPLAATVAGQTWRLAPESIIAGSVSIEAEDVWLDGGIVELPTENPWAEGVMINADRASISGVTFRGGGLVISIKGRDGTQILDNTFSGQSGTAIFVWGEGRGSDDTLIEGNTIDQAAARKSSPISSRAADDPAEGIVNRRITVRDNTIDQGDATTGWFGVELKLSPNAVIVGNDIRGGATLVSLPDSDGSIVSGNRFDLRGSPGWGVEIASSDDVTVEDNTFIGDGPDSGDVAISMNSGSLRAFITANRAGGLGALVDLTGDHHRIHDNCIANIRTLLAYRQSAGPDVDAARNGGCPET